MKKEQKNCWVCQGSIYKTVRWEGPFAPRVLCKKCTEKLNKLGNTPETSVLLHTEAKFAASKDKLDKVASITYR